MDNQNLAKELEALLSKPEGISIGGGGSVTFSSRGSVRTFTPGLQEESSDQIVNRRRRSLSAQTIAILRYLFVVEEGSNYVLYLGGDSDGAVEVHRQPKQLDACPEDDPPQEIPEEGGWAVYFSGSVPYPTEEDWQCRIDTLTLAKATMPMPAGFPGGAALEFYTSKGQALDINGNYAADLDARFTFGGSWGALSNEHDFELFSPTRRRDADGNFRSPAWYMMRVGGMTYYPDGFFRGAETQSFPNERFWVAYGPRSAGNPPPPIRGLDESFTGWSLANTRYELNCGWYPPDDPPDEAFRDNPIQAWLAPTLNKSYIEIRSSYECGSDPSKNKMIYKEYDHPSGELDTIFEGDREGGRLKAEDYDPKDWRSQVPEGKEVCYEEFVAATGNGYSVKSNNSYRFLQFGFKVDDPAINEVAVLIGDEDEPLSQGNVAVTPITVKTETSDTEFGTFESESCDFEGQIVTSYPCECYPAGEKGDFDLEDVTFLQIVPLLVER